MFSFLALGRRQKRSEKTRPRASWRPSLEVLEDRTVPSATLFTAGGLDPSFGAGGLATTIGNVNIYGQPAAPGVVVQPDGKIVVAESTSAGDITVARLNKDGSPDSSFGTVGLATIDFDGGNDTFASLAILPDGKIVVAATTAHFTFDPFTFTQDFAVARLNRDGSPDSGFGTAGQTTIDFTGGYDVASGMVILPDGKILLAGTTVHVSYDPYFTYTQEFAIARLNTDGSTDSGFGAAGQAAIDFPGERFAVQPDGKILVAGTIGYDDGQADFAVTRLNRDGSPDNGFGTGGQTMIDFAGDYDYDQFSSLAILPGGKILVAGTAFRLDPADTDFAVARLNRNGSLDSGFGTAGQTTIDFNGGFDRLASLVVQPDGKTVLAGGTMDLFTYQVDFAVARLNRNGSPDSSFGTAGQTTIDFGGGVDIFFTLVAQPLVLQPDGKIVLAGSGTTDFTIARLNRDGTADNSFGDAGQTSTDFDGGFDMITSLVLLPDGTILAVGFNFDFSVSVALAEYSGR